MTGINYTGGARNAHKRSKSDASRLNQKKYMAKHGQASNITATDTRGKDAERPPAMDASAEGSGRDSELEGTKFMRELERRRLHSQRERHLLATPGDLATPNVPFVRTALLGAPNWAGTATLAKRPHSPSPPHHDSYDLEPIRPKKKQKKKPMKELSPLASSDHPPVGQVALAASKWTPGPIWTPAATTGPALPQSALKQTTPISFSLPPRPSVCPTTSPRSLLPSPVFSTNAAQVQITACNPANTCDIPPHITSARVASNSPGKRARQDSDDHPRRSNWDDEALDSEIAGYRSLPPTNPNDFESLDGFSQNATDDQPARSGKRQRVLDSDEGLAASLPDAAISTSTLDLVTTPNPVQMYHTKFELPSTTDRLANDGSPTAAVEQAPAAPEAPSSPQDSLPELELPPAPTRAEKISGSQSHDKDVPAVALYTALASAHTPPIALPPAFFAPMRATWRGPSCVKKQQRVALERIWEWDESGFPDEDAASDALFVVEGMGLGCRGLNKAELREKRAREWELKCAWEASEAARKAQEAKNQSSPQVKRTSEAAGPDKDDPAPAAVQPEPAAPAPLTAQPTPLFVPIPPTPTPSASHSKVFVPSHLPPAPQDPDSHLLITSVVNDAELSTLSQIGAFGSSSSQETPEFEFYEDSDDEYVFWPAQLEVEAMDTAPVEAVEVEGVDEKTLDKALQAVSEKLGSCELNYFGDAGASSCFGLSGSADETEQGDGADGESPPRGVKPMPGAFWGDDDMEGIVE